MFERNGSCGETAAAGEHDLMMPQHEAQTVSNKCFHLDVLTPQTGWKRRV